MFAVAVDKKQLKKTVAVVVAVALLGTAVAVVGAKIAGKAPGGGNTTIAGQTAAQREEYLSALGLQYKQSSSVSEAGVPEEFDERFEQYNAMLKQAGFDLEPLKGESVTKCSYVVTNRQDLGKSVYAVLLVKDGVIVGGHLICTEDNSFYPLNQPVAEESSSILPEVGEEVSTDEGGYPTE